MKVFDVFSFGNATLTVIAGGIILSVASIFLFSWRIPQAPKNAPFLPGKIENVETHMGSVSVRVLGGKSGRPVVCLPGVNPALVDEWVPVAKAISDHGFTIYIINFHSNPRTKPAVLFGDISSEDVNKIIETLMAKVIKTDQIVLMGKSWGGGKAMQFSEKHPHKVSKLCLVAPASSDPDIVQGIKKSGIPVLLAWTKDDSALWFSNTETWKSVLGSQLELVTAEKGGHRILPEYSTSIIEFISSGSQRN